MITFFCPAKSGPETYPFQVLNSEALTHKVIITQACLLKPPALTSQPQPPEPQALQLKLSQAFVLNLKFSLAVSKHESHPCPGTGT